MVSPYKTTIFEEQCRQGNCINGNIRFADFAEYWFAEYAEKQLKQTTIANYRAKIPRINAIIGHIRMNKLQPAHIMQMVDKIGSEGSRQNTLYVPVHVSEELIRQKLTRTQLSELAGIPARTIYSVFTESGKGVTYKTAAAISSALGKRITECFSPKSQKQNSLSGKTTSLYFAITSSILQQAVYWQIIPDNPCHRVRPPKVEQKEARHLDEIEATQLMDALQTAPEIYRTYITVLLYMGYRRGEACGLEWSDIDFTNGIICVRRNTVYVTKQGLFDDTPKTSGSIRATKMPPVVANALKRWRSLQAANRLKAGDKWTGNDKVFTNELGRQVHPSTFTRWIHEFVKKNNLSDACLHSLRHTNATLLIASGTNLTTVSKRLGHASTAITARTYAHAIKTADEIAAETLQDILTIKKA